MLDFRGTLISFPQTMMDRRLFSDRCVTTAASAREKFPLRNQAARKDTRDLIILEAGSSQTLRMVGGGRRFDGNTGQKKIVCKGGEGGENQQLHRVRFILSGFPRAGALELRLTRGKGRRDFWELWRIGWCRCRCVACRFYIAVKGLVTRYREANINR